MSWLLWGLLVLMGIALSIVTAIESGDPSVGGELAHLTSVYAQSKIQSTAALLFGAWFLAMSAGLPVIRDFDLGVLEVLRSTRLGEREYVWGKFAGAVGLFLVFWLLYLCMSAGYYHVVRPVGLEEQIGPFSLWNYLFPTLLFALPQVLWLAGLPLLLAILFRRPTVVFLCTGVFFFFSTGFLNPAIEAAPDYLAFLDLSGRGWLNRTYLSLDRGVDFYNSAQLVPSSTFLLSRLFIGATGLAAVAVAAQRYLRTMRRGGGAGRMHRKATARLVQTALDARSPIPDAVTDDVTTPGAPALAQPDPAAREETLDPIDPEPITAPARASLRPLGMTSHPLGFGGATAAIARGELRDLVRRPGMYIFVPLLLLMALLETSSGTGPFGSAVLITPGVVAATQMNIVSYVICLLLLFYTVESLHKERRRGMQDIFGATPVATGAILLGKGVGNAAMAAIILGVALFADAVMIIVADALGYSTGFAILPFAATWGLVLIPAFIFWTALLTLLYSILRGRYSSYGAGLAILFFSFGGDGIGGSGSWVTNWSGAGFVTWSDMGTFALHGTPLVLSRLLYLSLVPVLVVLSIRLYPRRDLDLAKLVQHFKRRSVPVGAARLLALAAPAIILAAVLAIGGRTGFQGAAATDWEKDYWRANTANWTGFLMPSVSRVDMDLDFEPRERSVTVRGAYTFLNHRDYPYNRLPITAGPWDPIEWTMNGESHEPGGRSRLLVFDLEEPLAPGDSVKIGFSYDVTYLHGMSRGSGGPGQFILESGIVMNHYSLSFVPLPGYVPEIGVDEDNRASPRDYPEDFYEGVTEPRFGWAAAPFHVRTRITTPEDYTANGVGRLISDEVAGGRRTVVWETEHPVSSFNVIAGRFAVKTGNGTAIYHHPEHDYNVEEMSAALDSARHYFSEWFHPYPWELLKLSEFPAYQGYAQSYETNIVFSEGIGFLTRSAPGTNVAFSVAAHEAAHQWWGNMLEPGEGPGGNVLSEGMANYAAKLLLQQVHGDRYRMEFSADREATYRLSRRFDTERPLVRTMGPRTVLYDKGSWVMWMLQQEMGRENILAGLRAFIEKYRENPDHPVLYDMLDVVRDFAPDTTAFDAFAAQWFHDVVMPEYKLSDVTKTQEGDEWVVRGTVENVGTGRMRVEVAATAGFRWANEDEGGDRSVVSEDYRDARTEVVPGAGESVEFVIRAGFEPSRVVVDPDVMVLQLARYAAQHRFDR